jgi:hypothetical protein
VKKYKPNALWPVDIVAKMIQTSLLCSQKIVNGLAKQQLDPESANAQNVWSKNPVLLPAGFVFLMEANLIAAMIRLS